MSKTSAAKKSLIAGALVGTGGLFVAKLIGILYSIPFSYILGSSSYMAIYGSAYNIYSYFLTIFQSGIPFGVATLVAKYMTHEDYKAVMLIKKMSFYVLTFTGFIGMLILFLSSGWIAPLMVGENADIMANTLKILSLAVFLVPVLASFRGYYQGLKEMEEYAFSQAFEQLFRVGFLLAGACFTVYLFQMERVWALYVAVASTTVATIAAIWQFARFDQRKIHEVKELSDIQTTKTTSSKRIFRELIVLAIPFFVVAILGNIDQIFHGFLMPLGLRLHGYEKAQQDVIISAVTFVGNKLIAIPMILGPGFATAIIPHITSALAQEDYRLVRKNIKDCLNIVTYIALPVSFCIFAFAGPICNTLFYTEDLGLSTFVTQWIAIEGFLSTIAPLLMNLMLSLGLRKKAIRYLFVGTVLKGICIPILTWLFGYPGVVLSFMLGTCYCCYFCLRDIKEAYQVDYHSNIVLLVRMIIGILALWGVSLLLSQVGLGGMDESKMIALVKVVANGLVSVLVYVGVTYFLKVPQSVFHVDFSKGIKRILKRG